MAGSQRDLESTAPAAGDHRTSKIGKTILQAGIRVLAVISSIIGVIISVPIVILYLLLIIMSDANTFLVSSFIGLSLDPLFLYIPLIDENNKCLMLDKGLKIAALSLRTITDLPYIPRMFRTIKKKFHQPESCSIMKMVIELVIDIIAVLPIPQVVILNFLPNMRGSKSLNKMKSLNLLIVLQYMARSFPIFRFCMELNKAKLAELSPSKMKLEKLLKPVPQTYLEKMRVDEDVMKKIMSFTGELPKLWITRVVNFTTYIIAGHVFGAFWYFLSIQREMDCWGYACRSPNGCEFTSHCENIRYRNVKLLKDACPTNPPNATIFDFGIYAYPLQFMAQGSTNFSHKLLMCFSWGLRNLSSFASNLNASTSRSENFFVIIISISGLVLFIYLLGHLQTFMQETDRSDRIRLKMKMVIKPKLQSITSKYHLPKNIVSRIKYEVEQKMEENEDLMVENMSSILSLDISVNLVRQIKHSLFLDKLHIVPRPRSMLKEICAHLEPKIYSGGSYIIREGELLDMLFFITQGIVFSYTTGKASGQSGVPLIIQQEIPEDGLYGKELVKWAENSSDTLSYLPIWSVTVQAHKTVEVFALKASDLQHFLKIQRFR